MAKIRYLVNSVKFPENKSKPGRRIGIDWQSGDHLIYKILPENPDKSEYTIITRSVIEPDDGTNLRCNSEKENGWDPHKKIKTKCVQGTRKNPKLNPDKDNDLEEESEKLRPEYLSEFYQSGKGTCKTVQEKSQIE